MGFYYTGQAIEIMKVLAGLYPDARRVCLFICGDAISHPMAEGETGDNSAAMNPEAAVKNESIRQAARELGFVIESAAFDMKKLDFIETCDLHVGYDCHGSLSFLRRRIPSIMIAEDARGVGFSYTLGLPEFNGFKRCHTLPALIRVRKIPRVTVTAWQRMKSHRLIRHCLSVSVISWKIR